MGNTSMNKKHATEFLELIAQGNIDAAFERYILPAGRHHNVYSPAGFEALKEAMKENQEKYPNKHYSIKHVVAEGDMVAVYGHVMVTPRDPGTITVHFLRFADGKVVELWDVSQTLIDNSPNIDGPF